MFTPWIVRPNMFLAETFTSRCNSFLEAGPHTCVVIVRTVLWWFGDIIHRNSPVLFQSFQENICRKTHTYMKSVERSISENRWSVVGITGKGFRPRCRIYNYERKQGRDKWIGKASACGPTLRKSSPSLRYSLTKPDRKQVWLLQISSWGESSPRKYGLVC